MKKNVFILLVFCLASSSAFAWGPFSVYPPEKGGTYYKWGGNTVTWKYDGGRLSAIVPLDPKSGKTEGVPNADYCKTLPNPCNKLTTCGILMCVEHSINAWTTAGLKLGPGEKFEEVKTTTLSVNKLQSVGEDITSLNYPKHEAAAKNGKYGLIVFDEDGKILQGGLGGRLHDDNGNVADQSGLMGLTIPEGNSNNPYYYGGVVVLNGLYLDGESNKDGPADVDENIYVGSILHELGHLFGLDHSQPFLSAMGSEVGVEPDVAEGIPTMYPIAISSHQESLHIDDVVGISTLYPSQDFKDKFCVIKGDIKDKETGGRVQGVNVIAYASADSDNTRYVDERSYVSGVKYYTGTASGYYELGGIVPDTAYRVIIEGVHEDFRNFTQGVNPFLDIDKPPAPSNEDIGSGNIVLTGTGEQTVECHIKKEGTKEEIDESKTVIMKEKEIDVSEEGDGAGSQKKGWCMSIGGHYNPALWLLWPLLAGFIFILRKGRFPKNT